MYQKLKLALIALVIFTFYSNITNGQNNTIDPRILNKELVFQHYDAKDRMFKKTVNVISKIVQNKYQIKAFDYDKSAIDLTGSVTLNLDNSGITMEGTFTPANNISKDMPSTSIKNEGSVFYPVGMKKGQRLQDSRINYEIESEIKQFDFSVEILCSDRKVVDIFKKKTPLGPKTIYVIESKNKMVYNTQN